MRFTPPNPMGKPPVPLSMVQSGRDVRLVTVRAGRGFAQRAADMGFVPGVELRVVSNGGAGPLVVSLKGSRLVLGRGMAHKILVE
ncbi:ferrous iron transport protein A [bacterium]|nr:ferrous iron transport protein A [bacterium]